MWELPNSHRQLLEALARRPPETDQIGTDVLAELRKWGMVKGTSA